MRRASEARHGKTYKIRPQAEVVGLRLRKSEGDILLWMARTTEPGRREGPLLWLELSLTRKGR
jgi:hypothetical protein